MASKDVDENTKQILIRELVRLYDTHSSHAQVKIGLKEKFEKIVSELSNEQPFAKASVLIMPNQIDLADELSKT